MSIAIGGRNLSTLIPMKIWRIFTASERRGAIGLLMLMIIGMGFEMLGVGLIVPVMSLLSNPNAFVNTPALTDLAPVLGGSTTTELVIWAMAALILAYAMKTLFLIYLGWRHSRFSYGIMAQVSQRLFAVYLRQPYTFHLQRNSAQLIRNAVTETQIFAVSVIGPGFGILAEALVFIGLCTLMIYFEPVGAMIVIGVLGAAGGGFYWIVRKPIARWGNARQHHEGLRIQQLQQGLGAAKDVILLGRAGDFLEQYRTHSTISARVAGLQSVVSQLPRLWLEFLAVLGMAVLVLGMVAQGKDLTAILPVLGLFAAAALRLIPSVNRLLIALNSLRYGYPVVEALSSELQLTPPAPATPQSNGAPFQHDLSLEHITYHYPGTAESALSDLSLQVRCGETVGFMGASGAGKSTLVDVILGLLEPVQGTVLVDGADIRANLRNWQDQIGYVPQDIFLTDDTLRRNIAFGLPDEQIDTGAVLRAVRAAQLEDFVARLPEGLETVVGERGVRLSGGQRQRIGIARALYHDPPVLVLDEATSALDTQTEVGVMEAIRALHGAKTILIVAHRLSTVAHCDRIYRLGLGRIQDEGSPAIMLAEHETPLRKAVT